MPALVEDGVRTVFAFGWLAAKPRRCVRGDFGFWHRSAGH
jgi:hypothetical protein